MHLRCSCDAPAMHFPFTRLRPARQPRWRQCRPGRASAGPAAPVRLRPASRTPPVHFSRTRSRASARTHRECAGQAAGRRDSQSGASQLRPGVQSRPRQHRRRMASRPQEGSPGPGQPCAHGRPCGVLAAAGPVTRVRAGEPPAGQHHGKSRGRYIRSASLVHQKCMAGAWGMVKQPARHLLARDGRLRGGLFARAAVTRESGHPEICMPAGAKKRPRNRIYINVSDLAGGGAVKPSCRIHFPARRRRARHQFTAARHPGPEPAPGRPWRAAPGCR
jgi:hypothetical protein